MFYRRKIFLALIDAFGRDLNPRVFEQLLFMFCKTTGNNYYDFFPYKNGAFSNLAVYDKGLLIKEGYLADSDDYILNQEGDYLNQLKKNDIKLLLNFVRVMKGIKEKDVLKKSYLSYPEYAFKSELKGILNEEELKFINTSLDVNQEKCLFTSGYEGISIDEYLNRLIINNIKLVTDVRKNPLSMKYGFTKNLLSYYLNAAGIKYVHMPQLGIPSDKRKNIKHQKERDDLFDTYVSDILPKNSEYIIETLNLLNTFNRITLTCFEADHLMCHRSKITEWLADNGYSGKIVHL